MKAIVISWNFVFLWTIAVSLRIKPKAFSLQDSLKRIDDITEATRERKISSVKWHHKSKRIQNDNRSGKQKEDGKVVKLDMMFCQPYPSIVQVPEPADWRSFYVPSFVKLHRCAGGCSVSPRIGYCAVKKGKDVSIAVKQGLKVTQVVMSNHTACQCACLPKKCPSWKRFDGDICDCVCIDNGEDECNKNKIKRWDRKLCQCVCSIHRLDCDFGFKWNEESCKCELDENSVGSIAAFEGRV